jgi:hypothetical protein
MTRMTQTHEDVLKGDELDGAVRDGDEVRDHAVGAPPPQVPHHARAPDGLPGPGRRGGEGGRGLSGWLVFVCVCVRARVCKCVCVCV